MDDQRSTIPGSQLPARPQERWLSAASRDKKLGVTVLLRQSTRHGGPSKDDLLSGRYQAPSRDQAQEQITADPSDMEAVRSFLEQYGLKVVVSDPGSRRLQAEGTIPQLEKAFGVQIGQAQGEDGREYLTYQGAITVPQSLSGIVTAVLGLDERPVARHA